MKLNLNATRACSALLLIFALSTFIVFQSCSVSTANLSDVKVCTSLSGSECSSDNSTIPSASSVIYCSAKLNNAPEGTKVSFTWKKDNEDIGTANVETSSGSVNSNWNLQSAPEPGKYSVTIKINTDNAKPVTKEFTIE